MLLPLVGFAFSGAGSTGVVSGATTSSTDAAGSTGLATLLVLLPRVGFAFSGAASTGVFSEVVVSSTKGASEGLAAVRKRKQS